MYQQPHSEKLSKIIASLHSSTHSPKHTSKMSIPAFSDVAKASNDVCAPFHAHADLTAHISPALKQGLLSHLICLFRGQEHNSQQCCLQGYWEIDTRESHERPGRVPTLYGDAESTTDWGQLHHRLKPSTQTSHPVTIMPADSSDYLFA